jgi:hypothetical protein
MEKTIHEKRTCVKAIRDNKNSYFSSLNGEIFTSGSFTFAEKKIQTNYYYT